MHPTRAKHIPTEKDVTVVEILLKANDDIIVIYIDSDGKLDEDDYKNFSSVVDICRPA